ncbi:MAG TPA: histidine phosphatase family protein [Xanthobacteraceae bacterium]|nr:histidine phosphatase family protein [Xanthobacteraceae bacterium]
MRRLMLLRHAKTERPVPGEPDRGRKLTERGRADAPVIGAYMARHGLVPALALVSPATRAKQTWDLLAACFAKPPKVVREERIYNADPERLMALIAETHDAPSLLVVGHNPGIHELAVQLIATGDVEARERVADKLPTSGLVVIDLPFNDWSRLHVHAGRLEHFVSPRLLAAATE